MTEPPNLRDGSTQADVVITFNEEDSRSFFRNTKASVSDLMETRQYLLTQTSVHEMVATPSTIPKERWKTVIAFGMMAFGMLCTATSLSIVHERVPDTGPLPDLVLERVRHLPWALDVSEYLLLFNLTSMYLAALVHKHRWIVLRRLFFLLALIFAYRSVTMLVTALPNPSPTYYCVPKQNSTLPLAALVTRVLRVARGGGFSLNGDHVFCGDYIFSGHTATLTMCYLAIHEYTAPKLTILHWASWCVSAAGVAFLFLSHGHYTVDIVIGYWVTTRLWWMYHTMANFQTQRLHGYTTNAWWWRLLRFFEANVTRSLPYEFEWPLPPGAGEIRRCKRTIVDRWTRRRLLRSTFVAAS